MRACCIVRSIWTVSRWVKAAAATSWWFRDCCPTSASNWPSPAARWRALRLAARGTQTEFLGQLDDPQLREVLGRARAAILPGEEDYGLVPLEANASGRPAIAYGAGGALETIRPGITGEHFSAQTAQSLAEVLAAFDDRRFDPATLRAHAETFSPARFVERLRAIVAEAADQQM